MVETSLQIIIDAKQIVSTLQINIEYIKRVTDNSSPTDISLDIYNHEDRQFIRNQIDTLKLFYTDTSLINSRRADLISHEIINKLIIPQENVVIGDSYFCQLFAYKNNAPVVISNRTESLQIKTVIDPSFSLIGMDKMIQVRFDKSHIDAVLDISDNKDVFAFIFSVNERSQQIIKNNINIANDLSFNESEEYYYYNIVRNETQNNNYTIINGDIYEVTIGYANYLGDSNILSKNVVPSLIFNKPEPINVNTTELDTSLQINWTQPNNIPSYADEINKLDVYEYWIYRSTVNISNGDESSLIKIKELSGNILNFTDISLNYGTLYKYYIRAVRRRIISFVPGEVEPSTETVLNDQIIEGLLSDGVEGYVFQHNSVSTENPSIEYIPEAEKTLLNVNLTQPSSLTIQDNSINEYFIEYDISYNYKDINNNIIKETTTIRRDTIPETLENILLELKNDSKSPLDLEMNIGQTIQLQFKIRQIYKSNQYESLWSDMIKATPYSIPASPLNLEYNPDRTNDKQFYLSWDPIVYDPSYDAPYSNLIQYRVYVEDKTNTDTYNLISSIDTANTSVLISVNDFSMNYNEIYNFKVESYLPVQTETNIGGKTSDPTDAISDITGQTSLDVFIFEHTSINEPLIKHALTIDSSNVDVNVETPLEYLYTNDKYTSHYDLSGSFTIQNIQRDISNNISTDSSNTILTLSNITFGDTFNYQIRIVQIYRDFIFNTIYYSLQDVTTYTTPKSPTGLHIRSITDDGTAPLSTSLSDGRLKLSWNHIEYDKVNGVNGKYSNSIKYRILSYSESGVSSTYLRFSDNSSNIYEDISNNYVILKNLTIGDTYHLKDIRVEPYYSNEEVNMDNVVGVISGDKNSITSLLETSILSNSKNISYGSNGFVYSTSILNDSDVSLKLFSDNREIILSNNSQLNNVTLSNLSSISFNISNITGTGYLYIVINTNNNNKLYIRSLDNTNNYGKINSSNNNIDLSFNILNTLTSGNSGSEINNTISETDIITSIELKILNIFAFTLGSTTLTLNNEIKTLSFDNSKLRNLSDISIYNEILNKPFYYPDNVEGLYVDKPNVELDGNFHNIPLYWQPLLNDNISSNGGLYENIEYQVSISIKNISGTNNNELYVDGIDSSFIEISNNSVNNLYEIYITSIIRYNDIIMSNISSKSSLIYYILPSTIVNLTTSEANQQVELSWDQHSIKTNTNNPDLSFVNYIYEYVYQDVSNSFNTTDENVILSDLSNGITYTINVRSKYNYSNSNGYNEDFYSFNNSTTRYSKELTTGTTPFYKPIIDTISLSGEDLSIKLNNNGRPIREFLLVYIPDDNVVAVNNDILIDASSNIHNYESSQQSSSSSSTYNITQRINIDNDKDSDRIINLTTPYLCKYVLIVFENLAGSVVKLQNQSTQ